MADRTPKRRNASKPTRRAVTRRGLLRTPASARTTPGRPSAGAGPQPVEDRALSPEPLLRAISRIQALFIDEAEPKALFGALLRELLMLTASEYGFIGEVLRTAEGQPYLRTQAITDIAWNEETKALMAEQAPTLVFRNLQTLFGHVMTTGKPVIANDPAHDPRAGGLPTGHPPMHAFLGLPIYRGELLTGMVGMANRSGGYDDTLVVSLEPVLATCAQLLEGYRHRRLRADTESALRESEERWHLAVRGSHDGIWDWNIATSTVFFSARWKQMRGFEERELTGSLNEWRDSIHPEDLDQVMQRLNAYLTKQSPEFCEEYRVQQKDGSYMWVLDRGIAVWDDQGVALRMAGSESDITERKRENALQTAEKQALELVAKGTALNEVLAFICQAIEAQTVPMLCSVMLVTEDRAHLYLAAGPSLPEEYNQAIDRIPIGPTVGSCGSAAYFKTPSIVSDITNHPLWKNYVSVVLPYGLRACWSQPILSSTGTVLGTFAAYYWDVREPHPNELKLVERASHIAALAIEHARMTEALRESEQRHRSVITAMAEGIVIQDQEGHILSCNTSACRILGLTEDQVVGRTSLDSRWHAIHEDGSPFPGETHPAMDTLRSGRASENVVMGVHRPDGSLVWISINTQPIMEGDGKRPTGVVASFRDITAQKQREAELRLFRTLLDQATDSIEVIDPANGRFLDGNRQSHESIGYTRNELLALTVPDIDPLVSKPVFQEHMQRLREVDGPLRVESVRQCKDGTTFPVEVVAQIIRHEREYLVAVVRDITQRKQAEEHLRRTQFAMDQAVDAVYWIDPQARILYTNEAASAMLGYTADEFQRMTVHDLNPDFPPAQWSGWWEETRGKKMISLESVHLTKDGRRIPIDIRVSFLAYGGQEFHCAFVRDISERKRSDQALRESQERFELATRATNDGIWDWNILTGAQYWSDRHLELFGLEPGGLSPTYETWILSVHPDDADRVHHATCHHLETREPYDIEARVRMKDGRYRWFRDRGQAVWDLTGRPVRMVGSITDVTERRMAEEALRAAHMELERRVEERTAQLALANRSLLEEIAERKRVEDRLRTTQYAVDHAADQIFVIGPKGLFLDVNESACRRLGYTKDELLMMSVMDIDPDCPPERWDQCWVELRRTNQLRLETRHRSKTGEVYPVEVVANYLQQNGQEFDYTIVRDITDRKRAEEAIRESELRYKLLTEATFDGIAIHDQGILLEVNAGLERMFGYEPGELIGRSMWELIAEESHDLVLNNMRNNVNGPYEAIGRRKDGTTFPGEVVVRPYRYCGQEVRLVAGRDITERRHLEAERRQRTEELERQVAERTAEIAKLESQRAQAEKLAAMGRLAAGVAHEINNPIAGIKNAFRLVRQAVDPTHPQAEFVGMIDREITRVASIVQNMYQLYQPESRKREVVELKTMVQDVEALFAKQLQQRRLVLVIDADPGLDRLYVPRGDLLQVLLNLLSNAIDCSSEGGVITLVLRAESEVIRIAVSDQGPGIPPENVPHIFDPFFTTKTEGDQKGMGLGLSISQSLVMAMGGRIDVQTQPNSGSTFSVLLPCHTAAASPADQSKTIKEVVTHDY